MTSALLGKLIIWLLAFRVGRIWPTLFFICETFSKFVLEKICTLSTIMVLIDNDKTII